MPVFEYQATDAQGQSVKGTLFGSSLSDAASDLAQRGFNVQHLGVAEASGDPIPQDFEATKGSEEGRTQGEEESAERREIGEMGEPPILEQRSAMMTEVVGPLVGRIGLAQLLFFFRQLGTLLKAGVNIVQALDTLASQTRDPRLKPIVREMRDATQAGYPMSTAMQRYPEVFSPLMLSLIRAGEEGGMLDATVRQIAQYIEKEIELRNLVKRVTFYPKLVLGFSIVLILAVNAYIASLGKEGGLASPLTEPTTWIWLGPLLIGLFLFVRVGLHNPRVKHNWDGFVLGVPWLGTALKELSMAKFGRAFGALYRGGVAPVRAVELAADACGNEYMRARIRPAAHAVKEGGGITDAFARTGAFSPIVLDMTRTGETTGNLDEMLEQMAMFYEEEAEVKAHQFGRVFGVVVMVAVGIYVLYVVLNFYLGYFGGVMQNYG